MWVVSKMNLKRFTAVWTMQIDIPANFSAMKKRSRDFQACGWNARVTQVFSFQLLL